MELSKRIKNNLTTPKTILDLPSDLLLLILSRSDQKDLISLSLVSKPFLHLSNRFIRKLTFNTLPKHPSFKQIFTRFPSVRQITLNTKHVLRPLTAISKSQLNLQALIIANCPIYPKRHQMLSLSGKLKIKSLVLFDVRKYKAAQIVEFIRMFPLLEELYFGFWYEWDDYAGIVSLSLIVPNLRKIDLSRNHRISDRGLYALSANCVNLEHIYILDCRSYTPHGFCTFLRGCRNLRYLDLPSFSPFPVSDLLVAETVSACENIHHLSVDISLIRDATLGIIAKSRASLTSFKIKSYVQRPNIAYTMTGLSAMLCTFQGLTKLSICLPLPESDKFIDEKMSELVKSLPCLTGISITSYCPIYATLFSLIENCPLIECICLNNMNVSYLYLHCEVPVPRLIRKNYSLKYIHLFPSPVALFKIALSSFCPCLKNWSRKFPSEAFLPNNPALDWKKHGIWF